jgi:hypothetical protein
MLHSSLSVSRLRRASGALVTAVSVSALLALLATAGCASPRRPLVTVGASYSIMRDPTALEALAAESGPVFDTASGQVAGVVGRDDTR